MELVLATLRDSVSCKSRWLLNKLGDGDGVTIPRYLQNGMECAWRCNRRQ